MRRVCVCARDRVPNRVQRSVTLEFQWIIQRWAKFILDTNWMQIVQWTVYGAISDAETETNTPFYQQFNGNFVCFVGNGRVYDTMTEWMKVLYFK